MDASPLFYGPVESPTDIVSSSSSASSEVVTHTPVQSSSFVPGNSLRSTASTSSAANPFFADTFFANSVSSPPPPPTPTPYDFPYTPTPTPTSRSSTVAPSRSNPVASLSVNSNNSPLARCYGRGVGGEGLPQSTSNPNQTASHSRISRSGEWGFIGPLPEGVVAPTQAFESNETRNNGFVWPNDG
jgi:hypothetical protein